MDFLTWLASIGGVCTMQSARAWLPRDALGSMQGTTLWTPLRGWVALVGLQNDVTRSLQAGGVATCVTAFAMHGMWVPHGPQLLHVRIRRRTHSDRVALSAQHPGCSLHRMHDRLAETRPRDGVDSPIDALAVASGCVTAVELLAAADSALSGGIVTREGLRQLAVVLPRRRSRGLQWATGLAGSGTESAFVALLRRAHVGFVQQPELLPSRFVDFLIGRCLVVEIDSQLWHASPAQQAADRARDAELIRRGYIPLRFTYEQVLFQPEYVMSTVLAIVRRGAHLRTPRG
ncbi:MAG: endonuclease domain-containing protein [Actinomycetota bacterium]